MMLKKILMVLLVVGFVACNCPDYPECPECPEPTACDSCCPEPPECPVVDTLTCPAVGYTLEKSALKWECVENTVPPTGPQPNEYVVLSNAEDIVNRVEVDSRTDLYLGIWVSVRNLQNCAQGCTDAQISSTLGISQAELFAAAANGERLLDLWNNKYKLNLTTENKRADEDPRFEGKSNLRKLVWEIFTAEVRAHNALITTLNNRAYADPIAGCSFDNIQGWCRCKNQ
jgi:hypothetical protein